MKDDNDDFEEVDEDTIQEIIASRFVNDQYWSKIIFSYFEYLLQLKHFSDSLADMVKRMKRLSEGPLCTTLMINHPKSSIVCQTFLAE